MTEYETVIGLEIHVQLNTKTKLFSPAPNRFGDEPNTNISLVDTAQPGTLPVLNREAVHKAILFGLAVDAKIAPTSRFDRKSYFYPDSPRNFQITQFYHPIVIGGKVTCPASGKTKIFSIHHAHLEDDAGMLKHFTYFAGVDYNRAGTPLLEIVSEPCMHSPQDAVLYAQMVRSIVQYIDISDGNMEEGSFRMDVNVSIRPKGASTLYNKTEIKNLNSFTNMALAIAAEVDRQRILYEAYPDADPYTLIKQATYRFDPDRRETILMRTKETAADYRYFPEPDLPPLHISPALIHSLRDQMTELPHARYERYLQTLGLTDEQAFFLTADKKLSDYFEEVLLFCSDAKSVCNWIMVEFGGRLKESGQSLMDTKIPAKHVGELVACIADKTITGKIAKAIADLMLQHPAKSPKMLIAENPHFKPMTDTTSLRKVIDDVIKNNPDSVAAYKSGTERAFHFLVGQVMKETKGSADPQMLKQLLEEELKG